MPSYPGAIPVLGTYTGADFPQAAHMNAPNDEIEAVCAELGVNPRAIDDSIAPSNPPATIAAYLDMLANIIKTITGVQHWYEAAVPMRTFITGNGITGAGTGGTIAGGSTGFLYIGCRVPGVSGVSATGSITRLPMTFPGRAILKRFWLRTLTAQPATGPMLFELLKNGASPSVLLDLQPGNPASLYNRILTTADSSGDDAELAFAVNDTLNIMISNGAATTSAQIGPWALEFDQVG